MAIDEIKRKRIEKLKSMFKKGISAYPGATKRNLAVVDALKDFNKLQKSQKQVILAGRIRALREHGGCVFFDIDDGSVIQAFLKKDRIGEKAFEFFKNSFDIGDFVELRGCLSKTKRKEKTIQVHDFKILAKSLRPLPEKWHGLQDIEERYRKRYLDLIFNPEVKKKFELRSRIIKEIRAFLDKQGFIEVETPILQPIYGGAKAKPFKTHLNALDMDLYLRIAPELYLKRLLVGGFEKVYEIGKCFRNEGMDKSHNPDFTMLEFYAAYIDYKELMKLTEKLFVHILKSIFGKLEIEYQGKKIDFTPPWPRIEFNKLLRKYTKINFEDINLQALKKEAGKLGVKAKKGAGKIEIADEIYKKYCRPKIKNPVFVIHHPAGAFPLAKALDKNPDNTANFQLVTAGFELINAFSELNDPLEQKTRLEEQEKMFKQGFEEAQRIDKDFVEALEYGMPPSAGFGMGIDRLTALLTNSTSLKEVILFPLMKNKKND